MIANPERSSSSTWAFVLWCGGAAAGHTGRFLSGDSLKFQPGTINNIVGVNIHEAVNSRLSGCPPHSHANEFNSSFGAHGRSLRYRCMKRARRPQPTAIYVCLFSIYS